MLFLIYINDIVNSTSLNLLSFADDTTIYKSGSNTDNLTNVNLELKFFVFVPVNTNYKANNSIQINSEIINQVGKCKNEKSVKFLELYIDKHLKWKEHINIISSKIARAIFAINRVEHFIPHKALQSLYYALIHSHTPYGI